MLTCIAIAAIIQSGSSSDPAMLFDGLGPHYRKISTKSKQAERYFNQGLEFLFGFNHGEAIRSFTEAARLDPNCPMAYWGIAAANGPDINNASIDGVQNKAAFEAIAKARTLISRASPVERALIEASGKRFAKPPSADRTGLDKAYADAMRQVWKSFPRDSDVGVLFAESVLDLSPWHQWTKQGAPLPGTLEVLATLRAVLKLEPNHPQALHLTIHATEASQHPEQALDAANRLRFLQPTLGHMVHMPSHIYVRTGDWQEAVDANERAIAADIAYRTKRNKMSFYRFYMLHNWHMQGFAAMMIGESKISLNAIDHMFAPLSDQKLKDLGPFVDAYVPMPLEARIRFGKWDEILSTPDYPEEFPVARTLQHYARGIAFAAKGQVMEANAEQDKFEFCASRLTGQEGFGNNMAISVVNLARHMLAGEIALANNKLDEAATELRIAVRAEDDLNYDEPPAWIVPVRHSLGAVLVKAGRFAEAEQVYRDDLKRLPKNGWSLYGLAEALKGENKLAESKRVQDQFALAWKKADMPITSSCMCLKK